MVISGWMTQPRECESTIRVDPNSSQVEISARTQGVVATGSYHVFRGLRVEHVALKYEIAAMQLGTNQTGRRLPGGIQQWLRHQSLFWIRVHEKFIQSQRQARYCPEREQFVAGVERDELQLLAVRSDDGRPGVSR